MHVWEGKNASFIKHLVRKQLLLKHGSLHHAPPRDHSTTSKAAAFPTITKEPKEMESALKARQ